MSGFDPRLVARVETRSLRAGDYRNQARGFYPRSGEGARRFAGRFNPPKSFAVLYLCTTRPCVVAELTQQANRQNIDVEQLLPRELWRVQIELTQVLDLTDNTTLLALNLAAADLVRDDYQLTREIGEAAYEQQFQAVLTPSATGVDMYSPSSPRTSPDWCLRSNSSRSGRHSRISTPDQDDGVPSGETTC